MSSFDSSVFGDFPSQQIQDAVRRFADGLDQRYLRGKIIENVSFRAGETNLVPHGLGRPDVRFVPLNVKARPCSFKVFLSANQTGLTSGVDTNINFNVKQYDYGNNFDTATHLFTAPVTGIYEFTLLLWITSIEVDRHFSTRILVGGTTTLFGGFNHASSQVGFYIQTDGFTARLTEGQTVQPRGRLSSGSDVDVLGSSINQSNFSGRILGEAFPYVDESSAADRRKFLPLHAERPLTCDLWVY